jgi:NADH-quinone oxidoreductase subunit A
MPQLVILLLIFLSVGVVFLALNLALGRLLRPNKPEAMKDEVYECGEPAEGSPWVRFDLRFYVVALLFVIFDVEVAFFFPWAEVFGKATQTAELTGGEEAALARDFAWLAFADFAIFFGILLTGFAYLWHRGDLEWVRSVAAQQPEQGALPKRETAI